MSPCLRRIAAATATFAALAASASAASAATRLVATTGADTGPCVVTPCKTITYAVGQAAAGDTISIGPGRFAEGVAVTKSLTFVGAGAGTETAFDPATETFVDASATAAPGFTTNGPDLTIRDLRVQGGYSATGPSDVRPAVAAGTTTTLSHVTIADSVLLQTAHTATQWESALWVHPYTGDVTVSDSTIAGYYGGIDVEPGAGGSLSVTHTTIDDQLQAPSTGLKVVLGPDIGVIAQTPTTITDSRITSTVGLQDVDSDVTVLRTAIRAVDGGATQVDEGSGATLALRDSTIAPAAGTLSNGVTVYSNPKPAQPATLSLIGDSILALSTSAPVALSLEHAAPGSIVRVHNTAIQAIDPAVDDATDIATTGQVLTWDVGTSAFTTTYGAGVPAPGSGTNVNAVPGYADTARGDLHLQANSPLIDRGDASLLTPAETDVDRNPRAVDHDCDGVAQPDIGAYEAAGPVCPPHPLLPASPPAPRDRTKPVLSHLTATGGRLSFSLSEAATVTVTVQLAQHHRHGATTYNTIAAIRYASQKAGVNRHTLPRRLAGHTLLPGHYRVAVLATDAAGNRSSTHHLVVAAVKSRVNGLH